MITEQWLQTFLKAVVTQNRNALRAYFTEDAIIRWHNTNECFTVEQYIRANCDYPGNWGGEVKRMDITSKSAVSVMKIWLEDHSVSFHVISFIDVKDGKIHLLDEYFSEDGNAPVWRQNMHIGRLIQ